MMFFRKWRELPLIVFCLLSLSTVCIGSACLLNYASTPGVQGKSSSKWVLNDSLSLASPLSTLVMVVHPRCPCTQASISELAIVMAQCHNKVKAHVLFVSPDSFSQKWAQSDLWWRVKNIPGVEPVIDRNGCLAKKLNASTSGQTYVYDASGRLLFAGGITCGRGHEGDNLGVDEVLACINGSSSKPSSSTEVFGCSLFSCAKNESEKSYRQ